MKIWIKGLALAAVAAGVMMSGASAQAPPKHSTAVVGKPGAGPHGNPLNLTPAQQQQMRAISQKMAPEIQKAFSEQDPAKRQKQLLAVQAKYRPQMLKILNPAQRKQALAMEAQAKARVKAMMNRPAPKPAR